MIRVRLVGWMSGLGLVAGLASGCGGPDSLAEVARECSQQGELSCPRPILTVHDLEASKHYYEDKLGFDVDWDHGDPPDFASVSRGAAILFMCEGCQGTPGSWTMIFAEDVDALHEELDDAGAKIRMPPKTMPWGIRELHVSDLDGNVLRFGTGVDEN